MGARVVAYGDTDLYFMKLDPKSEGMRQISSKAENQVMREYFEEAAAVTLEYLSKVTDTARRKGLLEAIAKGGDQSSSQPL